MKAIHSFFLLLVTSSLVAHQEPIKTKWPQVLLTNTYKFKKRETVSGASAFLLLNGKDTIVCTAKHLLGEAMGVDPIVKTADFNKLLEYWFLYPRTEELKSSKIRVVSIINKEESTDDILLMKASIPATSKIKPLKVFRGWLKMGDTLFVAGCEYKQANCKQNIYIGTYLGIDEAYISVKVNTALDGSGFSGAPIFNKKMEVVGVIYGGHEEAKSFVFAATPIEKVFKYLPASAN